MRKYFLILIYVFTVGAILPAQTPEQKKAFDEDIARRKKAGIGAPGEDRYPYVPDLNGPGHMEIIAGELQKQGQPSSVIEKVLGANFRRVIGDIWGTG